MRWIQILDRDADYAEGLAVFLSLRIPEYRFCTGSPNTDDDTCLDPLPELVLAGAGFLNVDPDGPVPVLRLTSALPGSPEYAQRSDTERFSRLQDLDSLLEAVRSHTRQKHPPTQEVRGILVALLTDACLPVRRILLSERAGLQAERGGRIVYLPLVPPHRAVFCPVVDRTLDSVSGLTQLMLQIRDDRLDASIIGSYLHPSKSGLLCFYPVDHFDDLLLCGSNMLRELMGHLRIWMDEQVPESVLLADVGMLPETTTVALLAQCDEAILEGPSNASDGSGWTAYADRIAARLPDSCRLTRLTASLPCTNKEDV